MPRVDETARAKLRRWEAAWYTRNLAWLMGCFKDYDDIHHRGIERGRTSLSSLQGLFQLQNLSESHTLSLYM